MSAKFSLADEPAREAMICIFAKPPVAGQVKRRLAAVFASRRSTPRDLAARGGVLTVSAIAAPPGAPRGSPD